MVINRNSEIKPRNDYVKPKKERLLQDLNPKIVRWLEEGHFREALLGEGDFFIEEHTYRVHDALLVLQESLWWAKLQNRIAETSNEFEQIVLEFCRKDVPRAIDVLFSYRITSGSSRIKLKCDFFLIAQVLQNALSHFDPTSFETVDSVDLNMLKHGARSLAKEMRGFEQLGPTVEKLVQDGKLPPDKERKKRKKQ